MKFWLPVFYFNDIFYRQTPAKYLLGDGSLEEENRRKFLEVRKEKLREDEIKRLVTFILVKY